MSRLQERRAGVRVKLEQAPQGASGPLEDKYDIGAVMLTSDGCSNRQFVYATACHGYHPPIEIADIQLLLSIEYWGVTRKI